MKTISLLVITAILTGLAACGQFANSSTSDSQIQTAIIETSIVEATFQAAVYEAAQGALAVITPPATRTPEPSIDPYTLSEEELASLVDSYYEDAIYNSLDASEIAQGASADETITDDEIVAIINSLYAAQASITYASNLLTSYEEIYGELANETIDLLIAIEEDLSQLSASLAEIENYLLQGSAVATEDIGRINTALTILNDLANQTLSNKVIWRETVQANLNSRENRFSGIDPNDIATDRNGAILQIYSYLDGLKTAFEDQKISLAEMSQIAQLGANAEASLSEQGGPALQGVGSAIDGFTRQLSRGQWPQVKNGIGSFEATLPQRPAIRE